MCEGVVAKIQYHKFEDHNMPWSFLTLKNFTEVVTLAASGGFLILPSLYVVHIKNPV